MKTRLTIFLIFFSVAGLTQSNSPNNVSLIDTIGGKYAFNKVKLDSLKWKTMGLDSLETFKPYFDYSIICKFEISNSNIYIIERTSSDEDYHWACIINEDEQLLDWITTAYDNSEGFTFTTTRIKEDQLLVKEWNLYSNPEESITIYSIVDRKFKK